MRSNQKDSRKPGNKIHFMEKQLGLNENQKKNFQFQKIFTSLGL